MYELNGKKYTIEQLQEAAAKYNMDYNTYLETMRGKGLQEMTSDMTDEDALTKKADDIVANEYSGIYDVDLNEAEIEKYKDKTALNKEGDFVDAMYETEDGKFRRTKDTMSRDEVLELSRESYIKLINSDEYISGFGEKAMNDNKVAIQDIVAKAREEYDVTDPGGLKEANKSVNKQINKLIQEAASADPEYLKRTERYNELISERYGDHINGLAVLEKRQDIIDNTSMSKYMGWVPGEWNDLQTGLLNFKNQVSQGWNGFWNGQYIETVKENNGVLKTIEDGTIKPIANGNYVAGRYETKDGVAYRHQAGSAEELKAILEKSNDGLRKDVVFNAIQNEEYQKEMDILGSPKFFTEDGWTPEFNVDEYQELLTTQGGQMALGIVTFGGSTLIQEAGGAMNEMATYWASKNKFPGLDDEEAMGEFQRLDPQEKAELVLRAMERGQVNYDDAMKTGALNAGFDLVSNFFVIAKAGKVVKFAPKTFTRFITQKAYQQAAKYAWKHAGKDIFQGMASEVITENMQEITSMYHVNKNTDRSTFSEEMNGGGWKRLGETTIASAIVPGTLIGSKKAIGGGYNIIDDQVQNYLAKNDKTHLRNYVNKKKRYIETLVKRGTYTREEGNQLLEQLELAEQVQNDTKNKYVKGKGKNQIFENLYKQIKQQEKLDKLSDKKELTVDEQQKYTDLEEDIQALGNANMFIRLADNYDASGKTFAQWINDQEDGLFGNKRMNLFDTVKEFKDYIGGRIKTVKRQLKKDPKNKELQNELKELQSNSIKDLLKPNSDKNGANTGNNAWVIKELVDNNRNKRNDYTGANTVHHEALHFILDGFKTTDLKKFRDGILTELNNSTDPKMKLVRDLLNKRLNRYRKEGAGLNTKVGNEEFFTSISDALRYVEALDLQKDPLLARVIHKIGQKLQDLFGEKLGDIGIDYTNLNAENTLQFLKKYNSFNGKNQFTLSNMPTIPMPKGKQKVREGEEKDLDKFSLSIEDSNAVNGIWDSKGLAGAMEILDLLEPTAKGIVKRYSDRPNYAVMKDILLDEIMTGPRGMLDVIMSYDKYVQENSNPAPLSGYLNKSFSTKTGFKRYVEIANRVLGEGDQSQFTSDITEASGVVSEESNIIEDNRATKTLRKDLGLEQGIIDNVVSAVERTFGIRLPQVGSKEFRKILQQNFRTKLFKEIKNMMGTRTVYSMFINRNAKAIYKALPQATINKRFSQFAVPVLDKDGKQKRENTPQGNAVFAKKPFNQKEFEDYFLSKDVGASTRGTRKDALAESIAEELGFDATMETLQKPEVIEKFETVNEIQGFELPSNYLAILDRDLDRDRDAKFSLAVSALPEDLQSDFIANRKTFFSHINKIGYTAPAIRKAFDLTYNKEDYTTSERNAIIKDFARLLKRFTDAQKSYKKNKLKFDYKIEDYINTIDNQMDNNLTVAKVFGLKEGMSFYFKDEKHLANYRNYVSQYGQFLLDKNNGNVVKTLIQLITHKQGFENGTGAGKRAMAFGNKKDFIDNLLSTIEPEIEDYKFSTKKEFGGNRQLTITFKNGETTQVLIPPTSTEKVTKQHLSNDINIDKEALDAKEAEQVLVGLFEFMAEFKNNDQFTNVEAAMMVTGLLGNMKTVLRGSANFKYISTVLPSKNPSAYRYEHLIPARVVAFYMVEKYFNGNNNINTKKLLEDYSVAVIPKTMDEKVGKVFGQTMNIDYFIGMHPSKRYYNIMTRGEMQYAIKDLQTNEVYGQKYANEYTELQKVKKNNSKFSLASDMSLPEQIASFANMEKALDIASNPNAPIKGISVFDFDDTLATTNSKIIVTTLDGKVSKINATEFALKSADLEAAGAIFDFSEFNKVIDGKKGPLADLALKRQGKFGNKDIFILTARPQASANAIHAFLKGIGLEIPIENITGLENGTAGAKANWILGKAAEGYNNFYFADDAYKNVEAVQNVLDVIDVKNRVEHAKFSLSLEAEMDQIIEDESGVKSFKNYSKAAAQRIGAKVRSKFKFFLPPSAEDFLGLLYDLLAKGKKGDAQLEFFNKYLIRPFAKAYRAMNTAKQAISNDYRALKKAYKPVVKQLGKETGYKNFTYDQAIRVYLWNKLGIKIPGLSKRDENALVKIVKGDSTMVEFADMLGQITRMEEGYISPSEHWLAGTTASDLNDVVEKVHRKKYLREWKDNVDAIFTDKVMNKLEAVYGTSWINGLKDMLYRMETGRNRSAGSNKLVNDFMTWTNNSVGAIMFLNMRSAVLQTLSTVNFINLSDNNIFKAAKAFANQKQFWSDFAMIFNSPTLKQRRSGLMSDVNEAEIANAAAGAKNKASAVLAYLLKKGFLPTQIADSFAIAMGGATMFRNRVNTYLKDGLSKKEAESKAFDDFLEISEKTQQSARPDLISSQQAGPLGRLILAFQNTPMQYTRLIKKAGRDLANGRGDWKTNVSKILYYGFVQNLIFTTMQNALFGMIWDDEEDDEMYGKKKIRAVNSMTDTLLRGSGVYGAIASTVKNAILKFIEQEEKGWNADHTYTVIESVNLSPPIGSKLRKLYGGIQTWRFNKNIMDDAGIGVSNPAWSMVGQLVAATTNLPMDRAVQKIINVKAALDKENQTWQRIFVALGWNTWDLGIDNKFIDDLKAKERRKKSNKKKTKGKTKKMFKKK